MPFLDEVDSLRAKAGLSKVRVPVFIGVALLALIAVGAAVIFLWSALTSPGVVVSSTSEDTDAVEAEEQVIQSIFVHVTGAVVNPGMYELAEGSRVQDAVSAAGGLTEDAADESINLARELTDGEQIVVGSTADQSGEVANSSTSSGSSSGSTGVVNGKVNINVADAEALMTLDGIGEATAAKIIAYRESNGSFSSIEEIKEVSGIGDKKYEAIKDSITV